ncbi:MAG: phosphoribosylformylglycinamidine synthase subunit PurS [Myxococcota bacterium]|nr:phosphoribosylformylglycinamidine synthase [Deltaproteobacteria bacterium]MCP4244000.1 phosphoribosylformylglycinamidine synthase subunit PurS [bacterium]MDP6073877.1 phosphoribosylformylglycinamidine synthase subunit PurS [Myxococcota bacterium]MDP6243463.1 phosphoribosylformylglycinamidine synthase subunit PurS [Myxococcota bacterium]MDP7073642.1 phosphoribosylformylglycinamidine synthase subunit PurS [Myxococcota bacterium]
MKALVHVTLKPEVLDPQGKAIQKASAQLGYDSVRAVRQGKVFELEIDAADEEAARRLLGELCEKLLANPVIEDYRVVRIES